jgi:hypothetical protein
MGRSPAASAVACLLLLPVGACAADGSSATPQRSSQLSSGATPRSSPAKVEEPFANQSVEQILAAAQKATSAAESLHVVGDFEDQDGRFRIDVLLSRSGECRGKVVQRGGATIQVMAVEKRFFIRPDQASYELSGLSAREAARTVARVGFKWVESDPKLLGRVCDIDRLLNADKGVLPFADPAKAGLNLVNRGTTTHADVEVVWLAGIDDGDDPIKVLVALTDPHYVLAVSGWDDESTGDITLSDFDVPVGVDLPAKDDIIRLPGAPADV